MKQQVRLSPLLGLDGRRQAEQVSGPELPMRGGYNVQSVDGEWWSREGRVTLGASTSELANIGSIQWPWVVSSDNRDYIVSPWYALAIDSSGKVDLCAESNSPTSGTYWAAGKTEFCVATAGSANLLPFLFSEHLITVGDLIITGAANTYGQCFRVVDKVTLSGTVYLVLDREWTGATGPITIRVFPPFHPGPGVPTNMALNRGIKGSCCIFDQLVSETMVGPSLVIHRLPHIIITSEFNEQPISIALDDKPGAVVRHNANSGWFEDTSINRGVPSGRFVEIPTPLYCCVSSGRLIMGHAPDGEQDESGGVYSNAGKYASRTIWYSQPGNFARWHTGIQDAHATPNYITFDQSESNDIRGLLPLGGGFIVHRRYSQMAISSTGSGTSPFRVRENNQGLGLEVYGGVVEANGLHYLASQAGPASFDGRQVVSLGDSAREHLSRTGFWYGDVYKVCHDREQRQILWLTDHDRHQFAGEPVVRTEYSTPVTLSTYYSANPVFVYDYGRQGYWFEDHVTLMNVAMVGDGSTRGFRMDGTVLDWRNAAEFGKDGDIIAWNEGLSVSIAAFPVDAFVETPWMNFDSLERKQITKMVVQTRTWSGADLFTDDTTNMLAFGLDIMTNGDPKNIRESINVEHTIGEMRQGGAAVPLDENRQYGLMTFEISPRVSGRSFKFRFKNKPSGGSTANQGKLRIASIEVFFDQQESIRPLTATNRS